MNGVARSCLLLALIPALAVAAPRRGKKPPKKTTAPAKTETPAEPAPPPVEPEPAKSEAKDAKPATSPATPPTAPATPAPNGGGGGTGTGAGSGGGSGETPAEPAATSDADVDALRQEYLSLRDELFKSRARANTVASQLYSTRIQIKLTYTSGRFYTPAKSSVRLDGAAVYEDASGAIATDDNIRFDGYVAPGRHLVTFRVEAVGKDDDSFTSATESTIVIKAVAGKDLVVSAKAKDSGDIAYEWKKSEKGSYGLGIDVGVKTTKRDDAAGAKGKK